MDTQYNLRNPAVKRLMKEAAELRDSTELYLAQPLEDNLFEWHFSVRGPPDTEFDGGIYHGRIILPPEYPMKPPSIYLLTPNGRFETNKKICLSISGHHPESWQPSWSIRTALLAIIGFMPTHGGGAIGSLDYPAEERKKLARKSRDWKCNLCTNNSILKKVTEASAETSAEAKEIAKQVAFKDEIEVAAYNKGEPKREVSSSSGDASESRTENVSQGIPPSAPNGESEASLRQRRREEIMSEMRRTRSGASLSTTPTPVPPLPPSGQQDPGRGSLILIVLVSLVIALLLARRIFIINEWRFHSSQ